MSKTRIGVKKDKYFWVIATDDYVRTVRHTFSKTSDKDITPDEKLIGLLCERVLEASE
jgi:hypothetical protein